MSNEKAKLLENETDLSSQLEEKHDKLNKKWNLIQQGGNPASEELVKEVEELRVKYIRIVINSIIP